MKIGTKTLLFGVHQFLLHPLLVAWAWWKIFGFPLDPRLWIAFFVHDIGYWGKPNLDGPEGENHVFWGAGLMCKWFGVDWGTFCCNHSRFQARKISAKPSALCVADKLVPFLTPTWLYVLLGRLTGEIREYRKVTKHREGPLLHLEKIYGVDPSDKSWSGDYRWVIAFKWYSSYIVTEMLKDHSFDTRIPGYANTRIVPSKKDSWTDQIEVPWQSDSDQKGQRRRTRHFRLYSGKNPNPRNKKIGGGWEIEDRGDPEA